MPMSGSITASSVTPTARVRKAASSGSMESISRSSAAWASWVNSWVSRASTVSAWPLRAPLISMRLYSGSKTLCSNSAVESPLPFCISSWQACS